MDFTAEQCCKFARDCETETSPSVAAAGRCICLLERLKDDTLLLKRNSDAGILHAERDRPAAIVRFSPPIPGPARTAC